MSCVWFAIDKVAEVVVVAEVDVCQVEAMVAWLQAMVAVVMEVVDMVRLLEVTVSILLPYFFL